MVGLVVVSPAWVIGTSSRRPAGPFGLLGCGPGAAAQVLAEPLGLGVERGAGRDSSTQVPDDHEVEGVQVGELVPVAISTGINWMIYW